MAPTNIIDSHIHLWPEYMSNEEGHSWMTPGMPLAKEHLLKHYYHASEQTNVEGVIYIETDVRYDSPSSSTDLATWAKGPLDEIRFLRSIVEGEYGERDRNMLVAIVPWAPMNQPTSVLEEWLSLAEETAGAETWKRIKGFRFLLQFITNHQNFEKLVLSDDFIQNLKLLGRRGLSFDVGIDQNSGGIWQLQIFAKAMARAHEGVQEEEEKVIFILNHLCKPDFTSEKFEEWREAISALSQHSKTYMKLSGAFSELHDPRDISSIPEYLRPWTRHIFKIFGPRGIMFGSDWPVCNVKGPKGEDSWSAWRDVVDEVLDDPELNLTEADKERVWRGTAREAYRIP